MTDIPGLNTEHLWPTLNSTTHTYKLEERIPTPDQEIELLENIKTIFAENYKYENEVKNKFATLDDQQLRYIFRKRARQALLHASDSSVFRIQHLCDGIMGCFKEKEMHYLTVTVDEINKDYAIEERPTPITLEEELQALDNILRIFEGEFIVRYPDLTILEKKSAMSSTRCNYFCESNSGVQDSEKEKYQHAIRVYNQIKPIILQAMHLHRLPNEILERILQNLSWVELFRLFRVSKVFKKMCEQLAIREAQTLYGCQAKNIAGVSYLLKSVFQYVISLHDQKLLTDEEVFYKRSIPPFQINKLPYLNFRRTIAGLKSCSVERKTLICTRQRYLPMPLAHFWLRHTPNRQPFSYLTGELFNSSCINSEASLVELMLKLGWKGEDTYQISSEDSKHLLQVIIERGNLSIVQLFWRYKVNLQQYPRVDNILMGVSRFNESPLITAIGHMALDIAEFLLTHGIDPNEYRTCPIELTLEQSPSGAEAARLITLLKNAKAKPKPEYIQGITPLHELMHKNWPEVEMILSDLLEMGFNIDAQDSYGNSTLHLAAERENPDLLKFLLERKALPNQTNRLGRTPLLVCAMNNNLVGIKILLAHEANLNAVDLIGRSAFHLAAAEGHLFLCLELLRLGLHNNPQESYSVGYPLHWAVIQAAVQNNLSLLDPYTNADRTTLIQRDCWNNLPLHWGVASGNDDIAKKVLPPSYDINITNSSNRNALSYATTIPIATLLQIKGGRVKADTLFTCTDAALIPIYVKAGADVQAKDDDGLTPLHKAILDNSTDLIVPLVEAGSDLLTLNPTGRNALHLAVYRNNKTAVEAICKKLKRYLGLVNPDLESLDGNGDTALLLACKNDCYEAAEVLLSFNASILAKTKKNETPIILAARYGSERLFKLLRPRYPALDPTLLHILAPCSHLSHINLAFDLLNTGAEQFLSATDPQGETPLTIAQKAGNTAMALLFEMYANPTLKALLQLYSSSIAPLNSWIIEILSVQRLLSDGDTALHFVARKGDIKTLEWLLERGAYKRKLNSRKQTLLHVAALANQPAMIEFLSKKKVNLEAQDALGRTALHLAAEEGNLEALKMLLSLKAYVNATNGIDETPLHRAAEKRSLPCCLALIDAGADVDKVNKQGKPPLQLAAHSRAEKVCALLITRGAKINSPDQFKYRPWKIILYWGNKNLVELVAKKDPTLLVEACDDKGNTAFHWVARAKGKYSDKELENHNVSLSEIDDAAQKEQFKASRLTMLPLLQLLLKLASNKELLNSKNKSGKTPLHIAAKYNNSELIEWLLQSQQVRSGPDINGNLPLHLAAGNRYKDAGEKAQLESVRLLAKDTYAIRVVNKANQRPIEVAMENGHEDVSICLFKAGSPLLKPEDDESLLHKAAKLGFVLLIMTISDVYTQKNDPTYLSHKDKEGRTALLVAILHQQIKAVETLLCIKTPYDCDSKGNTPLHYAARSGNLILFHLILSANSESLDTANNQGQTPLDVAVEMGHEDIAFALMKAGAKWKESNNFFLHNVCRSGLNNILEHVLKQFDEKAFLMRLNNQGQTSLHCAVEGDQVATLEILCKEIESIGFSPIDCKNTNGQSVLSYALILKREKTCIHLLEKNFPLADTFSPLLPYAASNGLTRVLAYLLKQKNPPVNELNKEGFSPLFLATSHDHVECVRQLLANNANPELNNKSGMTPVSFMRLQKKNNVFTEYQQTILDLLETPKTAALPPPIVLPAPIQTKAPKAKVKPISSINTAHPSDVAKEGDIIVYGAHTYEIQRTRPDGFCGGHAILGSFNETTGYFSTDQTREDVTERISNYHASGVPDVHEQFNLIMENYKQALAARKPENLADIDASLLEKYRFSCLNKPVNEAKKIFLNAYLMLIRNPNYWLTSADLLLIGLVYPQVKARGLVIITDISRKQGALPDPGVERKIVVFANGRHYSRCIHLPDCTCTKHS